MPLALTDLLKVINDAPEGESAAEAVAKAIREAGGDADPAALLEEAKAKFAEYPEVPDSDSIADEMEAVADIVDGAKIEIGRIEGEAGARAERAQKLALRVQGETPAEDEAEAEAEEGAEAEAETAATETAEAGTDEGGAEVVAEAEAAVAEAAAPEAIAASAAPAAPRRRRPIQLSTLAQPAKTKPAATEKNKGLGIVAASGVPDFDRGQKLDGVSGLARAAVSMIGTYPTEDVAVEGTYLRNNVAKIQLGAQFPDELTAGRDGGNDQTVVDFAGNHLRLSGKNGTGKGLLAAGGWCSPSEVLYDLPAGLEDANAGILDLPELAAPRGGVRYTEGPDFSAIYSGIGFSQTEAQAIAGDAKTCYRIPCPDWDEIRAGVVGLCIEGGILQNDAFPELTERVVSAALVAHAHKVNATSIARMVGESTDLGTINLGPSSTASLLNTIENQIVDMRYRYRAPESMAFEVVVPIWLKSHIRADLSLRAGVDFMAVDDAMINGWFTKRGAKLNWVYDWQDAFVTTPATGLFGGATAVETYMTEVKIMIYPAGTFVRGRGDVISLDTIYDSTNIKVNDYVRLFVEEKLFVLRRQYQSRLFTVPLAQNGIVGAPVRLEADSSIYEAPAAA